tara:strand:+ start:1176 stop:1382 length:207 start_codon:yes stop_codon:yes gene_type:complete
MPNNRKILKINIWGAPNKLNPNRHPAGGYYHEGKPGKGDPDRGKTKRQKKIQRKKPIPGGYPNINTVA